MRRKRHDENEADSVGIGSLDVGMCMSLTGCKPSLPDDVLSQGKMEDILYDYHLALAIVQNEGGDETQRLLQACRAAKA